MVMYAQVPERPIRLALAVGLSAAAPLEEPPDRRAGTSSRPREHHPAGHEGSGGERRHPQARELPHPAPLLRDPPARGRLRHPHDPGTAWSQGRPHDHDLHARAQPRRPRRAQPDRWSVRWLIWTAIAARVRSGTGSKEPRDAGSSGRPPISLVVSYTERGSLHLRSYADRIILVRTA